MIELIANTTGTINGTEGSTPIAAWVAPTSAASSGVALFSEVQGIRVDQLDVWQLDKPAHNDGLQKASGEVRQPKAE